MFARRRANATWDFRHGRVASTVSAPPGHVAFSGWAYVLAGSARRFSMRRCNADSPVESTQ